MLWMIWIGVALTGVTSQSDQEIRNQIDTFMDAVMQCNNIPGASLSVVRGTEVFMTKGYGVRNLDTQEPLTAETMVAIASNTKAFMSTSMAKALEITDPAWGWDSPIRDILGPDFYLSDGYLSQKVTIRDLLCHRVGIGRHDRTRINSDWGLDASIQRFRHLESSRELRHDHQYNNLMYNLADKVLQTMTGYPSWENFVQEMFLDPLLMNYTTFVPREERWEDFSSSYELDGAQLREVSLETNRNDYVLSSAPGGMGSNAIDMAKWMLCHLANGHAADGSELVEGPRLGTTHIHCGNTGDSGLYEYPADPVNYFRESKGMGWYEGFYRMYEITGHSGSKAGMLSFLTMLRNSDIGIFVAVNGPATTERDLITMYIADLLTGETPWLDPVTICSEVDPAVDSRPKPPEKTFRGNKPLSAYEGTFGHFGYGNITFYVNSSTELLNMEYGEGVTIHWELAQVSDTDFSVTGTGIYWYRSDDVIFEDVAGSYDRVFVDIDTRVSPTFLRGLRMVDAPPPPTDCV